MIFKYGPLIWDTEKHNRPCPGSTPIDYNDKGIPIDDMGNECLPIECIIHPSYKPTKWLYSEFLQSNIPDINEAKKWFNDNYYHFSDEQIKKYIIRWVMLQTYTDINEALINKIHEDNWEKKIFNEYS